MACGRFSQSCHASDTSVVLVQTVIINNGNTKVERHIKRFARSIGFGYKKA